MLNFLFFPRLDYVGKWGRGCGFRIVGFGVLGGFWFMGGNALSLSLFRFSWLGLCRWGALRAIVPLPAG